MAKTMFDLLEGAMEDLGAEKFKKFISKMTDRTETRVAKGAVEGKDCGDIANLLIEHFTESRALEITLQILRNIKANQTAENLEKEAAANGFSPSVGAGGSAGTATPNPNPNPGGSSSAVTPTNDVSDKATFIDDKFVELVEKATSMNAVLDILLSKKVINDEQYNDIGSERTEQQKMRRLIREALKASGASGKAVLYDALMVKQPYMMKDLGAP
uniref:PYD and CARD domain containing n=1 Tax=Astyanax mexicanus TaxID=7994 RepID=A0A3B1IDK3_ASTMX